VFRSEKLVRISIQVPEQFISALTGILARFKLLHLIRIDETPLGRLGYTAELDGELLKEYDELQKMNEDLLESLQLSSDGTRSQEDILPEKEVFKIRERLGGIQREVDASFGTVSSVESTLAQKEAVLERLRLLPGDLDLSRLLNRTFIDWAIGLIPERGLEKLEESLSVVHHALVELNTLEERPVVLVFGLKKDRPIFERALKGALFEAIEIPPEFSGTIEGIVSNLASEISALNAERAGFSVQRDEFRLKFGQDIVTIGERILAARQVLTARRFFGKIDKSYLVTGWMPDRLADALEDEIRKVTGGQVVFEKVNPEDIREVREGIVKIPILFNNPFLISPFEKLTSLYGTPRYREIEPTVLFALSFLLLFGMMFGDVGQGGILFLLGYLIFRRFYRHMDYGIILMECGLVSALFGLLYGTIFGLENVIPALWFKPMDNIPHFVKVALSLGVALVSLGLGLNLINAVRLKEYEKLLGASGIAGAVLYWMCAGLAMKYLLTGGVGRGELDFLGWGATVLITIMLLQRPLYRIFIAREPPRDILKQGGLLTDLMESIVEVFDEFLRFVANTVSFIRVAAFALSHAALFVAVFSIANVVSHERGTGVSYWLVVAIGNIVIIFLEGLVVSIQTVRLEYYEFFGKFFRGGGEKFRSFDREIESEARRK
jgi:V/A-type H+/Na+-transporting ATPase subunit I